MVWLSIQNSPTITWSIITVSIPIWSDYLYKELYETEASKRVSIPIWSDYLSFTIIVHSIPFYWFLFQYGLIIYLCDIHKNVECIYRFLFQYGLIIYRAKISFKSYISFQYWFFFNDKFFDTLFVIPFIWINEFLKFL